MTAPKNYSFREEFNDGSVIEGIDIDAEKAMNPSAGFLKELFDEATAQMRRKRSAGIILVDGRGSPTPCFFALHRNQPDSDDNGWMMLAASHRQSQAAFILDILFNMEAILTGEVGSVFKPILPGEPGWEDRARAAAKALDAIAMRGGHGPLKWPALP